MTPTMELRFVKRDGWVTIDGKDHRKVANILQQKWKRVRFQGEADEFTEEEWRDVPVEDETK